MQNEQKHPGTNSFVLICPLQKSQEPVRVRLINLVMLDVQSWKHQFIAWMCKLEKVASLPWQVGLAQILYLCLVDLVVDFLFSTVYVPLASDYDVLKQIAADH